MEQKGFCGVGSLPDIPLEPVFDEATLCRRTWVWAWAPTLCFLTEEFVCFVYVGPITSSTDSLLSSCMLLLRRFRAWVSMVLGGPREVAPVLRLGRDWPRSGLDGGFRARCFTRTSRGRLVGYEQSTEMELSRFSQRAMARQFALALVLLNVLLKICVISHQCDENGKKKGS